MVIWSEVSVFQMPCEPTPVGSVGACDVMCSDVMCISWCDEIVVAVILKGSLERGVLCEQG